MENNNKSSSGQIVALVAALVMLLCFFLPWLEINVIFGRATLNGLDLIKGPPQGGQGLISLALAPLGALVVIILSIAGLRRKAGSATNTGAIIIIAAAVSGAAILYFYFSLHSDLNRPTNNPFEQLGQAMAREAVTIMFGAYAAFISSLAILVGGLIEMKARKQSVSAVEVSLNLQEAGAASPFPSTPVTPVAASPVTPIFAPPASGRIEALPPIPAFNAAPLATPSASVHFSVPAGGKCPRCGSQNKADDRFCTGCGADLSTAPPPPMPPPPVLNASAPATQPVDALVGQTLDGKYRIEAKIGEGGMGTVYRATRLMIGDTVALKVLHAEQVADPTAPERFRREAQAAARLKHPNAVTIHDFGVSREGLVYLVMELVEGWSLRNLIAQHGPLAPATAAEVMNQACAALDEAHRQNIVHRDLKPDNIIINTASGGLRVKVLDFGIAKLRDLAATASSLTQTGSVMGTPHYMSPEQCLGEELDSRSDIYSLGVTLYETLAGVVPFNSPTSTAVAVQHVSQAPPPLRSVNPNIPPAVEAVVMRALEKRREMRPQTAGALAQMLAAAVGGGAIPAAPLTPSAAAATGSPGLAPTVAMSSMGRESGRAAPVISEPFVGDSASPFLQTTTSASADSSNRKLQLIIAGSAVAIIALAVILYFAFFTAKRSILAEIKKGNLVKPEGSSAFDLYQKNKGSLSSSDVTEISNEVIPKLEARGNEIINNLRQETTNESEAGWAEAIRVYDWLNELRANKIYESRKYFSQARLDFLRKDYNRAIAGFRRASELDPSWAMAFNGLARAYLNAKDKYNAKDNYLRATNLDPSWIYPWINLGQLCLDLGDYAEAENALRQASNLDPQKASIHFLLGQVYEKTGNICAARTEYQTALNNAGNSPSPGFSVEALRKKLERLGCQNGY